MLRLSQGAPAFVFISSAKDSLIPSGMKKEYLTKMLTRNGIFPANLTLVDTAECDSPCGGPLGGWGYIKDTLGMTGPGVLLVVGSDQGDRFDPKTARMWETIEETERPSIQAIERSGPGAAAFSSTKARTAVAESGSSGLKPFLADGTNAITDKDIDRMAKALLKVQSKWKGGSEDISVFDDENEPLSGGENRRYHGRPTRRTARNRLGRATSRRSSGRRARTAKAKTRNSKVHSRV